MCRLEKDIKKKKIFDTLIHQGLIWFDFRAWVQMLENLAGYHHHRHHPHHVVPLAWISLTLSLSLSLATSPYRSSPPAGLQGYIPYPHIAAVCMFALVVLLLLGHIWGVHLSTSLMSTSLLFQQCPACLVRLTVIVFVMGGRWPYSWCLVGCCRHDMFYIARIILV